ncbi:KOW domain-containing protein OS=Bosea thiooxidans OX=53254 GN=SAMN05660750_03347 PE=4 SV=1 [Bosea thiooxidans]|uniref:KOW domain-containing protein n=1 Tax=Bosea thiooxidans TaxID=53254 RepID=A0A1T5FLT4_9HYPH|nr:hypothetical protein [Bosea thiooxidans]SKB97161.1 hypothetical protein SAMN05660750_03347 [Bosea thiooxidans]
MSRPTAKPVESRDPIVGRRVRVLRGPMAGREGRAVNSFRQRIATADRVMIELDGCLPGWSVASLKPEDVEVLT